MSKCDGCNGACCKYVTIFVGGFTRDQTRWAELRGEVLGDGRWRLPVKCKYLNDDGRCGIYPFRPGVCREFAVDGVECNAARAAEGAIYGKAEG